MAVRTERLRDGREVRTYRLGSEPGVVLEVMDLGATVRRLEVTGGDDRRRNVALGHAEAQEYVDGRFYHGAVVGRYANRIAGGRFDLDGREIHLSVNDRGNHLHGGAEGFHLRTWEVLAVGEDHLELRLVSPDGDQGFPGTLTVYASYLVAGNVVSLDLHATADATTVVNLTSHVYLNLDGEGEGSVDAHWLRLAADRYLPVDEQGIPLGEPRPVDATAFDLRSGAPIGSRQFDHSWLPDPGAGPVVTLASRRSATSVAVHSDQPAVQVYTADDFDGSGTSTSGVGYPARAGVALEPQLLPDTPHHPTYPSAVVRVGQEYHHRLRWEFAAVTASDLDEEQVDE